MALPVLETCDITWKSSSLTTDGFPQDSRDRHEKPPKWILSESFCWPTEFLPLPRKANEADLASVFRWENRRNDRIDATALINLAANVVGVVLDLFDSRFRLHYCLRVEIRWHFRDSQTPQALNSFRRNYHHIAFTSGVDCKHFGFCCVHPSTLQKRWVTVNFTYIL